jgi:hypothetical protein
MSTPSQPGAYTPPPALQPTNNDVYSRMVKNAVDATIEDVIFIDASVPNEAADVCTCGNCGTADFELVGQEPGANLSGAPLIYIETRSDSDPLLLDEMTISADLETLTPARNVTTDLTSPSSTTSAIEFYDEESDGTLAGMIFSAAPRSDVGEPDKDHDDDDYLTSFNPSGFNPFDPAIDENTNLSINL